jgi:glycosyltransferase involved in cell wall biosynthesis
MRFIWLMPQVPFPLDTGGKLDTFHILREFSLMGHEIAAGIMVFEKEAPHVPDELSGLVNEIFYLPGNTKALQARLLGSLVDDVPFKFRKYYSEEAVKLLADRIAGDSRIDAVFVDHLHLAPLALDAFGRLGSSIGRRPLLILRTPNVESTIVRKYAERVDNPMVAAFAAREARKMKDYESRVLSEFDLVAAISPVDLVTLRKMSRRPAQIISVTGGMQVDQIKPPSEPPTPGEVVFVGSLDWQPNVDGVMWLIEKVWPLVAKRLPDSHLSVIGKSPPPYLEKHAGPTITFTGRVDSVEEYVGKACCCVVPLWIGSGMRYKILEAFALARAVVSTSIGAEGIEVADGESILIRDDPETFADAVALLLTDSDYRSRIGMSARILVEEKYSWPKVARGFSDEIEALRAKGVV